MTTPSTLPLNLRQSHPPTGNAFPRQPQAHQTQTRLQNPGSGTATPTTGSATQTINSSQALNALDAPVVLRLRGQHNSTERRIQWAEDVVDNENLGRKNSKVCCIYHRPKGVDESDSESSGSDSDTSDSADDGAARPAGGKRRREEKGYDKDCGHGHGHEHEHEGSPGKARRKQSPNAYEKQPKAKGRKG